MAKRSAQELGDIVVSVTRLHLDSKNPRHDPLESDTEVIAELCAKGKVLALANDIAQMGSLSPLEQLGAIPMEGNPGHYISVEGNRRTCALLLLHDPSRAPSPELRAQFKKANGDKKPPKEIKLHVFANRAAAKPWIDRRHLGEQDGVGTFAWDADQKARAAGTSTRSSSSANALSLAVLDRLTATGALSKEEREATSLTTITRYLGTPGVRAVLGLGSGKQLIYTHDEKEVDDGLVQLVKDSISEKSDGTYLVNSRTNSQDRLQYANSLKSKGIAPSTQLPAPIAPPPPTRQQVPPAVDKKRSATDPSKIRTLYTSKLTITQKDSVLLRLRKEALEVNLDDYPFSGNYILRALLERVMILFLKKRGRFSSDMNDQKLTQMCAAELKELGIKGPALAIMEKASNTQSQPYSLHSLGHAVHGGSVPSRAHLRSVADTLEPSIRAMLDAT